MVSTQALVYQGEKSGLLDTWTEADTVQSLQLTDLRHETSTYL